MDSFREHPSDFELPSSEAISASQDVAAAIGTDERRMHVRAYNHWVGLLEGRDFPSIEDLEPSNVQDFSAHSVLLDFTCGGDNPAIPFIGATIRDECGLDDDMRTIADVPSRSLLSRLTDHYMQIIANRAPVGFEAEFDNPRGETICYRGILMPFSSDGETIDFIYGVINWKRVDAASGDASLAADLPGVSNLPVLDDQAGEPPAVSEMESALPVESSEPATPEEALEVDEPIETEEALELSEPIEPNEPAAEEPITAADAVDPLAEPAPLHFSWEDGPLHEDDAEAVPLIAMDDNAGLADRLCAARETAEAVKANDGRTRAALYQALSLAYDFALAARASPQDYAELLEESGVKAQVRAPMTPIVKLVFGIDYDKARLTEFAAALAFAQRQQLEAGDFLGFIERQPGGLKAMVAAERQARRPEPRPDIRGDAARAKLRGAPSISLADVPAEQEFAVVVTRRNADGSHEPIAIVEDEALIERAIRKVA
jgi:hypothetical protein